MKSYCARCYCEIEIPPPTAVTTPRKSVCYECWCLLLAQIREKEVAL